ncbi:MAG TPA: hypothetical protein VNO54_06640 [Streptosporangiaceae bacterium]|nr:hypothetical protein [Streptosporangiaceae bacterium]
MHVDPALDAAVRAHLAAQPAAVTGTPSAGVYGDQAGAQAPPVPLDLSAAAPTSADVKALLARIEKMETDREAERVAALPVPDEPPDLTPILHGAASGELRAALAGLHARLVAVEEHVARVLASLGL